MTSSRPWYSNKNHRTDVFIAAYRTNILAGTLYTRPPDATRTIKTDFSSHRCTIRPSTISPDCALRRTAAPSFISDLFFLVIFRFAHANLPGGLRGFYHGTAGTQRRAKYVLWLVFTLCFAVPNAQADTVTNYTINFTGSSILPTSGSFTYDSAMPGLSNFIVVWDGFTFNLTSSANNPTVVPPLPGCVPAGAGPAESFALLSGCASGTWAAPRCPKCQSYKVARHNNGCTWVIPT
jgi:hypothetical protein